MGFSNLIVTGGFKSVQRGTILLTTTTSATASVSAVNVNKAVLSNLGYRCVTQGGAETAETMNIELDLMDASTVRARKFSAFGVFEVSFELVEYQ